MAQVWITEFDRYARDSAGLTAGDALMLPSKRTQVLDITAGAAVGAAFGDDASIIHVISDVAFHFRASAASGATVADKLLEPGIVHEFGIQQGNRLALKPSAIMATVTLGGVGTTNGALESTQGSVLSTLQDIRTADQSSATALQAIAPALPPTPLMGGLALTTDLTGLRVNLTGAGQELVIPGVANSRICVYRIRFKVAPNAASGSNISIFNGTSGAGTLDELVECAIGEGLLLDFCERPHFRTTIGADFTLKSSAAVSVQGRIGYAVLAA